MTLERTNRSGIEIEIEEILTQKRGGTYQEERKKEMEERKREEKKKKEKKKSRDHIKGIVKVGL